MKNDMLVKVTEASVHCRVCGLRFVPGDPGDRKIHKEDHRKLARGGLPFEVREFMKGFGWAVARNDGGIDRLKGKQRGQDRELGKLAVLYAWWARARMKGIDEGEFDEYMAAYLRFIDAIVERNAEKDKQAGNAIKRWEKYA